MTSSEEFIRTHSPPMYRCPMDSGSCSLPNRRLHWMPMFNNRGDEPVRVKMKVNLTLIRAKDLVKPLKPLYGSLRSVEDPPLVFCSAGKGRAADQLYLSVQRPDSLPRNAHSSSWCLDRALQRLSERTGLDRDTQERRGRSNAGLFELRRLSGSSRRKFSHSSRFIENPTDDKIDAMAGLFMLYSARVVCA